MADPYRILGVERDATDEEIKTAYRNLAKKYHPDAYVNNPLADLAEQKMAEINEAYDKVMEMRRGTTSDSSSETDNGSSGSGSTGDYARIRQLITNGDLESAESMLNNIPESMRGAEWNFLKGSLLYSKGWLDEAAKFFSEAVRLEPYNQEYRAAYNRMMWQRGGGVNGNPYGGAGYDTGCSVCDMCSALMCADCLCHSFRC